VDPLSMFLFAHGPLLHLPFLLLIAPFHIRRRNTLVGLAIHPCCERSPSIYLGTNPRAEASQYFRFVIGCGGGAGELISKYGAVAPEPNCDELCVRGCGHDEQAWNKGYVIEAQSHELRWGGILSDANTFKISGIEDIEPGDR
jgi:hypothetical protein